MTAQEAIEKIRKNICNESGVAKHCHDNCMYGIEHCAFGMAIRALEKQIPQKVTIRTNPEDVHIGNVVFRKGVKTYKCKCGSFVTLTCKYCPECGQRLEL